MAIAFTVSSHRPGYLERALDSWSHVPGVAEAHMIFCLEPGPPDSVQLARDFRSIAGRISLVYNPGVLGPAANTRVALERALGVSDYAIVTEEDVVVSDDILAYHSWARRRFSHRPGVAGVCSYTRRSDGAPDEAFLAGFFNPLAWGTWRDRLPVLTASWGGIPGNDQAWDLHLLDDVVSRQGRQFAFPCRSRSQHIGKYGQRHDLAWYASTVSQSFSSHYEPQRYREVTPEGR